MDIMQLVDQLEDVLNDGWRVPLTSALVVNEEECLRIIDQLRVWLPEEIKQARRIRQDKDRIMGEADREAERLVASVRGLSDRGSERRVGASFASDGAQEIIAAAEQEAQALREGASQYARESMERLQNQLELLMDQVHAGISHLESTAAGLPFSGSERSGTRSGRRPDGSTSKDGPDRQAGERGVLRRLFR